MLSVGRVTPNTRGDAPERGVTLLKGQGSILATVPGILENRSLERGFRWRSA